MHSSIHLDYSIWMQKWNRLFEVCCHASKRIFPRNQSVLFLSYFIQRHCWLVVCRSPQRCHAMFTPNKAHFTLSKPSSWWSLPCQLSRKCCLETIQWNVRSWTTVKCRNHQAASLGRSWRWDWIEKFFMLRPWRRFRCVAIASIATVVMRYYVYLNKAT